jgi:hypothetical protein
MPRPSLWVRFAEIDEQRYCCDDIFRLYQSAEYPPSPSRSAIMMDKTIDLDQHRGMSAQKATELRRLLADVEANEKALRLRQEELESHLLAAPATNWAEAAEKARYLLNLFAATLAAEDPRRQKMIAAVLADFERLSGDES